MQPVTTIGLDIAKSVFQVHGVGAAGQVVIRRQLKRRYVVAFFQKAGEHRACSSYAALQESARGTQENRQLRPS
jgi:transposase